jgi:hypothetical protein
MTMTETQQMEVADLDERIANAVEGIDNLNAQIGTFNTIIADVKALRDEAAKRLPK